ncbi:MAG TPA: class I SAM-dependent methyltransferase [Chthoniobacterales bacterium]
MTGAILEHLPPPTLGARVLDVACGTGEPGLSLARRSPDVQLLGVDAAAGMIESREPRQHANSSRTPGSK